jgi:hypothetical protein
MWVKTKNILSPSYITVADKGTDLHFYVTGNNLLDVDNVSNAVEDFMNHGTKSPLLKRSIVMDEVVLLENGVKVGVVGQVRKVKKDVGSEEYTNNDRIDFLREFVKKF